MELHETESGLLVTVDSDEREEIAAKLAEGRPYDSIWVDLIEPFSCNGSYTYFNAGDGNPFVGLTSAPCIAESMGYADDGARTIQGKFWYFDNYMIDSELEELATTGKTLFTLAS